MTEREAPEQSAAEIHHQMEDTRTDMADKVEALEHQVMDLVHDATAAVSGTIDSMKEAVGQTVDTVQDAVTSSVSSVKHALDISGHVRQHPWLMLGAAVALGYLCGSFLLRRR